MKRCRPTWLGITGTCTALLGVTGLTWGSLKNFDPQRMGIALLIVGVTLICYKRLETKSLAADEIYKIGYDRGKEDGYDEGYEDRGMEQPAKPVIVPLPLQRCPDCGHSVGLVPVGSVADRG